jgi:hypothetical protein
LRRRKSAEPAKSDHFLQPLHQHKEDAIKSLLSKHEKWTLYSEYTDASTLGERAQRLTFEFFVRDQKLMGRHVLELGGEFEVTLRSNGFSFPWCPPYTDVPSLDYDPADPTYSFKSSNPRKLWLHARE